MKQRSQPRTQTLPPVTILDQWVQARLTLARAYLEFLALTARLEPWMVEDLDHYYPGISRYAVLGRPLRECSADHLWSIAKMPHLIIDQADLSPFVREAQAEPVTSNTERNLIALLLSDTNR